MAKIIAQFLIPLAVTVTALTSSGLAQQKPTFAPGTWTPLKNAYIGTAGASHPLLLTDGTVIIQDLSSPNWYKLTPDNTGSYVNGTWSTIAAMAPAYGPLYYASAVLDDGRVIIDGGEYNLGVSADTDVGEIYDPAANTWTPIAPPPTAGGDQGSVVFPDGTWMVQDILNTQTAITTPSTCPPCVWTLITGTGKDDRNDEENWNLLPDGSVLTVDVESAPLAQRYIESTQTWVPAGNTIVRLEDPNSEEVGPAVLLPSGKVFATGACVSVGGGETKCAQQAHTSVYTYPSTWTPGPDFPNQGNNGSLNIADGPGSILPYGNVLLGASPGIYLAPLVMLEYDGSKLNVTSNITNAASDTSFEVEFLALPSGEILETDFSTLIEIYHPAGKYQAAWQPQVTTAPTNVTRGTTYTISGKQFNGVSQGAMYGDDWQMNTNYPLVRAINDTTKHVRYWKTHNHSTMGVQTGSTIVSTEFDVPSDAETGCTILFVIANGIPSNAVFVEVH